MSSAAHVFRNAIRHDIALGFRLQPVIADGGRRLAAPVSQWPGLDEAPFCLSTRHGDP
jgi:hypothetical protein